MPMYVCPKCGNTSYQAGGRPVCCYCGKVAPRDYQLDLFRPMCGGNVATQRTMFPSDEPRQKDGPRVPDLPGQTTFA